MNAEMPFLVFCFSARAIKYTIYGESCLIPQKILSLSLSLSLSRILNLSHRCGVLFFSVFRKRQSTTPMFQSISAKKVPSVMLISCLALKLSNPM